MYSSTDNTFCPVKLLKPLTEKQKRVHVLFLTVLEYSIPQMNMWNKWYAAKLLSKRTFSHIQSCGCRNFFFIFSISKNNVLTARDVRCARKKDTLRAIQHVQNLRQMLCPFPGEKLSIKFLHMRHYHLWSQPYINRTRLPICESNEKSWCTASIRHLIAIEAKNIGNLVTKPPAFVTEQISMVT